MAAVEQAEAQLAEMDLLSSMFPSEDEFKIEDQLAVAELRDYAEGRTTSPPSSRPHFIIRQKLENSSGTAVALAISCTHVPEYPKMLPDIAVRCSELNRAQLAQLQKDLSSYLVESCSGEVCVLAAVQWLKDNTHLYLTHGSPAGSHVRDKPAQMFTRLWIYSHHIYNKTKRKNILDWARELALTGFSMPGKPGVVCVEGDQTACDEFWTRLKSLNWQRIMIKHREDVTLDVRCNRTEDFKQRRKFGVFEEALFDPHGSRGNHMDLGQFYQFLTEHDCGDVFQMYFGVEGR